MPFARKSSPAFAGEGDHAKHGGGALPVSEEPLHRTAPKAQFILSDAAGGVEGCGPPPAENPGEAFTAKIMAATRARPLRQNRGSARPVPSGAQRKSRRGVARAGSSICSSYTSEA